MRLWLAASMLCFLLVPPGCDSQPATPATPGPQAQEVDLVPARRGVGKDGRYEDSGMIITPLKVYFLTRQRTELEIKIPHAMQLYRAEHGHYPETREDFMRDIIEMNQVKLPELPDGHRYVYNAHQGQLQVAVPRQ